MEILAGEKGQARKAGSQLASSEQPRSQGRQ